VNRLSPRRRPHTARRAPIYSAFLSQKDNSPSRSVKERRVTERFQESLTSLVGQPRDWEAEKPGAVNRVL